MKTIKITFSLFCSALLLTSCSDFLEEKPQAILNEEEVNDPDKLVTSVYSDLGNDHYTTPNSLWPYGTVRSDDAYKGGSGEQDIQEFHFFETSTNITTDIGVVDGLWFQCYRAISRANTALRILNELADSNPVKTTRIAEARFLRGHFYFLLKILFKNIPYIDETIAITDYGTISNVALNNDELWAKIADDFQYATDNLPDTQPEKGRANRFSAAAYLAKTYLYKAYRQDDKNAVIGIDQSDLQKVLTNTETVIGSRYNLESDFAFNFLPGDYENGEEAIFSVQHSQNDGTKFGRLNFGDLLSTPMKLGCCDFHKPSQSLVNAFSTINGLPDFTSYNSNVSGIADKTDPRLFHTVAIPGFPYKYNTSLIYAEDWNRNPGTYGVYASLKENVDPSCDCFVHMDPFYANSKNRILIRYADILLMRAEAFIELKQEAEALPLINQVRNRAKNSTIFIDYTNDKIEIALYPNTNWTNDFAKQALRWERRLEFAMEGGRFFDLVRWGIADQVMNEYYQAESLRRPYYGNASFVKGKHEYVPIPENQIKFSKYLYKQNPGYGGN
ncbi:glycan metabolism protein RagB [Bacteroidia bacterium]|nr:glycan metabolism protein RagB [Bacteroidia bacterium]